MRDQFLKGRANAERRAVGGYWDGVAVVASYQSSPKTDRPYHVTGRADTPNTVRHVQIALTRDEARKLVADFALYLRQEAGR